MGEREIDTINEKLLSLIEEFKENHVKWDEKENKSAGKRARKALGEIKNLVTPYRKSSIATEKER